ncbi:right-handed parallel beta-helix repeat-containing protein [Pseudomonadota bacterium]
MENATASTRAERATARSLIKQINDAIHAGLPRVRIEPGDYRIGARSDTILPIEGAKNLVIIADGVNLIATDLKRVISFHRASNVTFRGATIDYDPLPFTQGTVIRIDKSTFDVEIHNGYKSVTGHQRVIVYDNASLRVKDGTVTRYGAKVSEHGKGVLRVAWSHKLDALAVGDLVSVTGNTNSPHGLLLQDSIHVTLQNITVHASTAFGFFENGGGGNQYKNVRVIPGPLPKGATRSRLLSSNADAFHSKHTSRGPTIIGSHFTNQGDDGIAINTDFHLVCASFGNQLAIGAKTDYDLLRFQPGDRLRGLNLASGEMTEAVVLSIARDSSLDKGLTDVRRTHLPNAHHPFNTSFRVTLDRPLQLEPGDLVFSPGRNGNGFEIRDTTIKNHRARGILIKASDGIIENNLIDGSSIGGIVLAPELFDWQEAGFSRNIVIRGNKVLNTSRQFGQPGQTQAAGIAITSDPGWVGQNHSNILIEDNVIDGTVGPALIINAAKGVRVINNHFMNTHDIETNNGESVGIDPTAVIWVDNASNVSFSGNTVSQLGPFGDSLLRSTSRSTDLSGQETGIRLVHDES